MDNDFQGKVLGYLAELTQNITEMRQDINGLSKEVGSLTQWVTNIEIQVENNISPKITTLFDGWQQNTDQLNRIEEKVSTHEEFIVKRI